MQDEGHVDAPRAGAGGTEGLHQNPYQVEVTTFGRASPVGRCSPVIVAQINRAGLVWNRLDIERLELSHVSALLVIQGLPLKKLFEGVLFSSPTFQFKGVYTLLRGGLSSPIAPPLRLEDIVLAEVVSAQDWSSEEILSAMLREVFPSPQQ